MDDDDVVTRDSTAVRPVGSSDYVETSPSVGAAEDNDRNPVFSVS